MMNLNLYNGIYLIFPIVLIRWVYLLFQIISSYFFLFLFGFGEKTKRILMVSFFTIVLYAIGYYKLNALTEASFQSSLYFSIVTFTTLGYGDVLPKSGFRLFAASEAISGAILSGLFLFTLTRKAVGR